MTGTGAILNAVALFLPELSYKISSARIHSARRSPHSIHSLLHSPALLSDFSCTIRDTSPQRACPLTSAVRATLCSCPFVPSLSPCLADVILCAFPYPVVKSSWRRFRHGSGNRMYILRSGVPPPWLRQRYAFYFVIRPLTSRPAEPRFRYVTCSASLSLFATLNKYPLFSLSYFLR